MTIQKNAMTANQLKFANYYVESRNGVRSYAKAYGYNYNDPEQRENHYNSWAASSSLLMKDDRVQGYISNRLAEFDYDRDLSPKEITNELNKIALGEHFNPNIRMDALKQLVKINGMTDESTSNQAVNINLSSNLETAIEEARTVSPLDNDLLSTD